MQPQTQKITTQTSESSTGPLDAIPLHYKWIFTDLGEHGETSDGIRTRYGVPCSLLGTDSAGVDKLAPVRFVEYYQERYAKPAEVYKLPPILHYIHLDTAIEVGPALAIAWLHLAAGNRAGVGVTPQLCGLLTKARLAQVVEELIKLRRSRLRSRRYDEPAMQKAVNRITRAAERARKEVAGAS